MADWTWQPPLDITGSPPTPRFDHSMTSVGDKVFVVGGSDGDDILRSGVDLADIYVLDLSDQNVQTTSQSLSVHRPWYSCVLRLV